MNGLLSEEHVRADGVRRLCEAKVREPENLGLAAHAQCMMDSAIGCISNCQQTIMDRALPDAWKVGWWYTEGGQRKKGAWPSCWYAPIALRREGWVGGTSIMTFMNMHLEDFA